MPPKYTGSMTTVGNSQAIRFEKSFFQALNLPAQSPVRFSASILSPGNILLSIERPEPDLEETDAPYLAAFLAFIEKSFLNEPEEVLVPVTEEMAKAAKRFAEGAPVVGDDSNSEKNIWDSLNPQNDASILRL